MKAIRSLRRSVFLAAAGLSCAQAWGQWWWPPTGGLQVSPACLDTSTQVSLTVSGNWPDSCIPNFSSAGVNGNEVDILTVRDPPPGICLSVITAWQQTSMVGPLAVGSYSVFVTHRVAGQIVHPRTMVGSFVVVASCTSCYANCDGSTSAPILNVSDFVCFLNRYAAADTWANCDGSTNPPVLNVNDFVCYNNAFSAGCP